MTTLFLPIAPPAAGKSTLANLMVEAGTIDADAIVCPDTFRRVLTGDTSNQDANGLVFEVVDKVTRSRFQYGLDVYLDATNLNGKGRQDMINRARSVGAQVHAIIWDVTLEECIARNAARDRTIRVDVIERMYEAYSVAMEERIRHEDYDMILMAEGLALSCEEYIDSVHHPRMDPWVSGTCGVVAPKSDRFPLAQAHADENHAVSNQRDRS